jgi:predicted nucleic acid-binding protein
MKVLVDTSVWSLALRRKGPADHPAVVKFAALLRAGEDVVLCGLVLQEVLQAFRSETSFLTVRRHLDAFPILALERRDFVDAAALHRRCAAKGVGASTADCQIAVTAIRHRCMLLSADKDFERIASVCDLELG